MIQYFDPFGAKIWNIVHLNRPLDDWALYCSGRRNPFGTTMAARGTRAEVEALVVRSCLV